MKRFYVALSIGYALLGALAVAVYNMYEQQKTQEAIESVHRFFPAVVYYNCDREVRTKQVSEPIRGPRYVTLSMPGMLVQAEVGGDDD